MRQQTARILLTTVLFAFCWVGYARGQQASVTENTPQAVSPQPLAVAGLPGTSFARLISRDNYISPFASLFGQTGPTSSANDLSRFYRSRGRYDLSRVPEMFGDFRSPGLGLTIAHLTAGTVQTELPTAAGIGGLRIAENNHALPRDRVWVGYNHFHNALDTVSTAPGGAQLFDSNSLNRFVIGAETLLDDGRTSLEVRMTFGSAINTFQQSVPADPLSAVTIDADSIGNLGFILKRLIYGDRCKAVSIGMGVETPTGSDTSLVFGGERYEIDADAVHLVPFLAYTERYDRWFAHAFGQIDVALGGDSFSAATTATGPATEVAVVDPALTLGLDIGLGYRLIPATRTRSFELSAISELHGTIPLESDDVITVARANATVGINTPLGTSNGLLNWTNGLVVSAPNGWSLRSGVAVPVLSEQLFDSEIIVQLNRLF